MQHCWQVPSPWEQLIGQPGEAVLATTVKDRQPRHLQLCASLEPLRKDINKTFSSVLTFSWVKIMYICPPTRLFEWLERKREERKKKKKKNIYIHRQLCYSVHCSSVKLVSVERTPWLGFSCLHWRPMMDSRFYILCCFRYWLLDTSVLWQHAAVHNEHHRQCGSASDPAVPTLQMCGELYVVLLPSRDGHHESPRGLYWLCQTKVSNENTSLYNYTNYCKWVAHALLRHELPSSYLNFFNFYFVLNLMSRAKIPWNATYM